MGNFIFFIILIWIVVANIKKGQKKSRTTIPNQPRQANQPRQTGQYGQRPAANGNSSHPVQNAGYGTRPAVNSGYQQQPGNVQQNYVQNRENQQQLKNRLQQKYGSRPAAAEPVQKKRCAADDIIERAISNVKENEQDETLATTQIVSGQAFVPEESELMKQVENLIVKGYSGDLTFERDFVAEGVEMLNRFEITE